MKKKWIWIGAAALVVVVGSIGAVSMKGVARKAPEVQTAKVSRQKIVQKVNGTGRSSEDPGQDQRRRERAHQQAGCRRRAVGGEGRAAGGARPRAVYGDGRERGGHMSARERQRRPS